MPRTFVQSIPQCSSLIAARETRRQKVKFQGCRNGHGQGKRRNPTRRPNREPVLWRNIRRVTRQGNAQSRNRPQPEVSQRPCRRRRRLSSPFPLGEQVTRTRLKAQAAGTLPASHSSPTFGSTPQISRDGLTTLASFIVIAPPLFEAGRPSRAVLCSVRQLVTKINPIPP
jgi:hypothetical protein